MIQAFFPIKAEPADIGLDGFNKFGALAIRIGVIEPQSATSLEVLSKAKVETDRLRMSNMEVPVGFRRKTGRNALRVAAGLEVGGHELADEVSWRWLVRHGLAMARTGTARW